MKKVFTAQHHAEAHLVKGLLEVEGIEAEVRGEALFTTVEAASVIPGMQPEVWILDQAQTPAAMDLVSRYSKGESIFPKETLPWECPECGEEHEPQFHACWKCGTPQPQQAPAV